MADDYYSMLGILSPEAEAVQAALTSNRAPAEPTRYPSQYQPVVDYHRSADAAADERDNLALQAEIQRRISLPTQDGRMARGAAWKQALEQAMYEKQAKALMDDLRFLDPADPEALTQQDEVIGKHPIARKAMSDPRIANLIRRQSKDHEEMQRIFDSDPDSLTEYTALRATGGDPSEVRKKVIESAKQRADRLWFASNGGSLEDFDAGKFNDASGRPDKAKMASFLYSRKAQEDSLLSSTERKALDETAMRVRAFESQPPETEDDKRYAMQQLESLKALVEDFRRAGKSVPDVYLRMVGGSPVTPPEPSVPQIVPQDSAPQNPQTTQPTQPLVPTKKFVTQDGAAPPNIKSMRIVKTP